MKKISQCIYIDLHIYLIWQWKYVLWSEICAVFFHLHGQLSMAFLGNICFFRQLLASISFKQGRQNGDNVFAIELYGLVSLC